MTSYHGGKQRIGLEIAENIHLLSTIIEDHNQFVIKGYCEPFCGMLGVYRHIHELFNNHSPILQYQAGDSNESVIKMWKKAVNGWKPPIDCSEQEYDKICNSTRTSALKGYIGHQFSFGGQFCKGYSLKYDETKDASKASERIQKISKQLSGVQFKFGSYTQFSNLEGYVIYCDPPYQDSECRYNNTSGKQYKFNHQEFWNWVRFMSDKNIVFVSEYMAPSDFTPIMVKEHSAHVMGKASTGNETLFIYQG